MAPLLSKDHALIKRAPDPLRFPVPARRSVALRYFVLDIAFRSKGRPDQAAKPNGPIGDSYRRAC
jgi:hypothetical protein